MRGVNNCRIKISPETIDCSSDTIGKNTDGNT